MLLSMHLILHGIVPDINVTTLIIIFREVFIILTLTCVIHRLLVPLCSCRMEFVLVLTFYTAPTINCYEVYFDLPLPYPAQPTAQPTTLLCTN